MLSSCESLNNIIEDRVVEENRLLVFDQYQYTNREEEVERW